MDLVIIRNRKAVTSSKSLSEMFKRSHKSIVRSIYLTMRRLRAKRAADDTLFCQNHFYMTRDTIYMDRSGFDLLITTIRGDLSVKIRYIEAFNAIERKYKL